MTELCSLSLKQVQTALATRELSATEVTQACLDRIEATEPEISALLHLDAEAAKKQAACLDAKGPGKDQPLFGIPVTIKDALCTRDMPTTAASRILEGYRPPYDAFAVERLRQAGAVILGKNNMDEFAMGSSTENSAYRQSRNPWNTTRVPGGSSGGSAASVAACQCFASLGSDTGGSIRQPASFCGCVGLKPTYGCVSRYGLIAYGSSLDQIGPLARSVGDCAIIQSVIAAHDPRDATCAPGGRSDVLSGLDSLNGSLSGVRLGLPEQFFGQGLSDDVRKVCESAISIARDLGAEMVPVALPHTDAAIATYYIIAMAEASSNLARFDGVRYGRRPEGIRNLEDLYVQARSSGFGQEVRRRIMLGAYVLSSGYYDAYYRKAAQVRRLIRDEYLAALEQCDVLLAPVAPVTAWEPGSHADPLQAYLMDAYTLSLNLAGLPGLALPVGLSATDRMPVGMQLIGPAFAEARLLSIGQALESSLPGIGLPACK